MTKDELIQAALDLRKRADEAWEFDKERGADLHAEARELEKEANNAST